MENRFQYILLTGKLALASLLLASYASANEDSEAHTDLGDTSNINSEVFELGVTVGIINIADFNSEFSTGISATFKASEDFFLQYNLFQAEASPSAYENSQGKLFEGSDRTFRHYDLLVGYNVYQGELFLAGPEAKLSALYLVGGVGDTRFGGEDSFTYTLGVGYQVAVTRNLILRVDYRSYIYTSNVIADEDKTVNSTQFSSGLSYLF